MHVMNPQKGIHKMELKPMIREVSTIENSPLKQSITWQSRGTEPSHTEWGSLPKTLTKQSISEAFPLSLFCGFRHTHTRSFPHSVGTMQETHTAWFFVANIPSQVYMSNWVAEHTQFLVLPASITNSHAHSYIKAAFSLYHYSLNIHVSNIFYLHDFSTSTSLHNTDPHTCEVLKILNFGICNLAISFV